MCIARFAAVIAIVVNVSVSAHNPFLVRTQFLGLSSAIAMQSPIESITGFLF